MASKLPWILLALPLAGCAGNVLLNESAGASSGGTMGASSGEPPPVVCTPGATEPCYSGLEGTLGVGSCQGGSRTCAADGSAFGGCTGEVTPAAELCGASVDTNCDGTLGCSGAPQWSVQSTGEGRANAFGVGIDGEGNVLVTGSFLGTVDFGLGPETSAGLGFNAFVMKLDGQDLMNVGHLANPRVALGHRGVIELHRDG